MSLMGAVRNLLGIKGADGTTIASPDNPVPTTLNGSTTSDGGVETTSKTLSFDPAVTAVQIKNVGGSDLIATVTDNGVDYPVPDQDTVEIRLPSGITEVEVAAPGKWYWMALS